jgi:quercetin dioxygenase-like cupin family protein
MSDACSRLISAIRQVFAAAAAPAEAGEDIVDVLAATERLPPSVAKAPTPESQAALVWLPAGTSDLAPICTLAREAAPDMPWHYSYSGNDGLAVRIAFADVLGPEGPVRCSHLRLGLTLVAPHTLYPMHAHPARELYFVLSGRAEWTAGDVLRHPPPGAFVLHPSGVAHAMRTADEALLAVYVWRGDIMTAPFYTSTASIGT